MKKIIRLSCALIILLNTRVIAQKNFAKEADKSFYAKEFYGAIDLYKKAYEKVRNTDRKSYYLFQIAECYRHISDYNSSETYYNKAIAAKYNDPISYYHLATIKKTHKKYNEAIDLYMKYQALVPSSTETKQQITSCQNAQQWLNNPTRHVVENMVSLNSKDEDFAPSFADYKKYNKIYFTTTRTGALGDADKTNGQAHSDIFSATLSKDGKWSTPSNDFSEEINSNLNEGAAIVSRKADFMIFTRCEEDKKIGKNRCHLYMSKKIGPSWGKPESLPMNIDTIDFRHPSLSKDGNILVFSSNMSGSYGHHDLWKCEYDKKTKSWGIPVNLGPEINTSGNEGYPFLHDDGKTLYYSTDGLFGLGGLDIYKVEISKENKVMGKPVNLMYPMNSPYDDFGIIFQANNDKGYLSSNREGGKGNDDIWSFVLPKIISIIDVVVKNEKDSSAIGNCEIVVIGNNGKTEKIYTDANGKFKMELQQDALYKMYTVAGGNLKSIKAPQGYFNSNDTALVSTIDLKKSTNFIKEFYLEPVPLGEIHFPEVLYEVNKWDLLPSSKDSLNYLYNLLIQNPTLKIELSSHTDSRGSVKDNDTLSIRRARSCVDYLVSKGIAKERMVPIGWGKHKLLIKDVVIAKEKTKQGKDALHQKNRRTMFRILSWEYKDPNKPNIEIPLYKPKVSGEGVDESTTETE